MNANARAIILSPHLDDAVLSCWHLVDSERDVSVVNVFTGVPPPGTALPRWDRITGADDPAARVRERIAEDRAALALASREPVNLPFVEAQYREDKPTLNEVLPTIRAQLSGDEEVFVPAGIGAHSAHQLIRVAGGALEADGFRVVLYADLPYATEFGWPAWVTGESPDPQLDVDAHWAAALQPEWEPIVVPLDETARRRKVAAMTTYRTQFAALEAGPLRRLTHPELVAFEVVWTRVP